MAQQSVKKDVNDESFDRAKHDETHHAHPANSDEYNLPLERGWGEAPTQRAGPAKS